MGVMVTEANGTTWEAPFCSHGIENMECPICGAEDVRVREDSSAEPREAYCGECHAILELDVFETFGNPVCVEVGDVEPPAHDWRHSAARRRT
jgi:hypothetical protein